MHRIELELATVTPAFIGTSDSQSRAEWTAKSVRGHLRWWLRAVLGGELRGNAREVRKCEEVLFGSNSRKSAIRIVARPFDATGAREAADGHPLDEEELVREWGTTNNPAVVGRLRLSRRAASNPVGYLGYGPIIWDSKLGKAVYGRARIRPGQSVRLLVQWSDLRPDSGTPPKSIEALSNALWCWVNLGGIGGRSRRGFGSLVCRSAHASGGDDSPIEPIATLDQFKEQLRARLARAILAPATAEWSHFTSETRVYVSTSPYDTWEAALMAAGAWLIAYRRRYGLSTDERGKARNRDYVWLNSPAPAGGVPDRAGFGLPLPFGKGDRVAGWRRPEFRGREETGRRGSPLLIHISHFGKDYRVVLTHVPARLVPAGAEIHFHGQHSAPTSQQQNIVRDFLDDLEGAAKKKIGRIL
jgi:CRISPR-associated protein Cmr1